MRLGFGAALAAVVAVSIGSASPAQEMQTPSDMTLEQLQTATIKNLSILNALQREMLRRDPSSAPFEGYDPSNIDIPAELDQQIRAASDEQLADYMIAGAERIEALVDEGNRRLAGADGGNQPAGDPPAAPAAAAGGTAIVAGEYACTHDYWTGANPYRQRNSDPFGTITIAGNGTYSWLSNGGSGRFEHDAASGAIIFSSGPMADKLPREASYRLNQRTSQIDINFGDGVDWSCGHNL